MPNTAAAGLLPPFSALAAEGGIRVSSAPTLSVGTASTLLVFSSPLCSYLQIYTTSSSLLSLRYSSPPPKKSAVVDGFVGGAADSAQKESDQQVDSGIIFKSGVCTAGTIERLVALLVGKGTR